tara:strand:+ start:47 stop:388 length:342 start_codon:yes stop_codon:yes gene_type:complete
MLDKEEELTDSSEEELKPDTWGVKVTHRDKNRMKITFKLNQDESAAFTNFENATRPEGLTQEHFIKSIFFLGLTTLENNVAQKMGEHMKVEDGEVSFDVPEDEGDTDETSADE